ncbi:MAG: DUF2283 domain-containing protein [Nanoarchaeota archaeon]
MKNKNLNEKGESGYDYKNDILFFKAKDREYSKSIELNNLVIDIDANGYVTGLQIFEASRYLGITKDSLIKVPKWQLKTLVNDNIIEIRLNFQVIIRNKVIEKNPIITQALSEELPNSELVCVA